MKTDEARRDVVLVTIDCWRYDAPSRMTAFSSSDKSFERRDVICQAPATRGAFPSLLASKYYPQAYDGFDTLKPSVRSISEVLSDNGYVTCGVVGSNPFLSTWGGAFDNFWNDEMDVDVDGSISHRFRAGKSTLRHALNYLRMQSRVPATAVADRARKRYESRSRPRFLWMHLMDIHLPFFPGLSRAMEAGMVSGYRSHLRFLRDPGSLSDAEYNALERFYWQSVERLDEQLPTVLEFVDDDALVVVTGDHGEEFDHGKYGHARLFDECVRVPLYVSSSASSSVGDGDVIRQLDVPATLLDAAGCAVPDSWEGAPGAETDPFPAFMVNHSPQFGRLYGGVRTDRYKLWKSYDDETDEIIAIEAYDHHSDPDELQNIYDGETPASIETLERRLDDFLARDDIRGGIREQPRNTSDVVEDRLHALGYK